MADEVTRNVLINVKYVADKENAAVLRGMAEDITKIQRGVGGVAVAAPAPGGGSGSSRGGGGGGGSSRSPADDTLAQVTKLSDASEKVQQRVFQNRAKLLAMIGREEAHQAAKATAADEARQEKVKAGHEQTRDAIRMLAQATAEWGIAGADSTENMVRGLIAVRAAVHSTGFFDIIRGMREAGEFAKGGVHEGIGRLARQTRIGFTRPVMHGARNFVHGSNNYLPGFLHMSGVGGGVGALAGAGGAAAGSMALLANHFGLFGSGAQKAQRYMTTQMGSSVLDWGNGTFGEGFGDAFADRHSFMGASNISDWMAGRNRHPDWESNRAMHPGAQNGRQLRKNIGRLQARHDFYVEQGERRATETEDRYALQRAQLGSTIDFNRSYHFGIDERAVASLGVAHSQDAQARLEQQFRVTPNAVTADQRMAALDSIRAARQGSIATEAVTAGQGNAKSQADVILQLQQAEAAKAAAEASKESEGAGHVSERELLAINQQIYSLRQQQVGLEKEAGSISVKAAHDSAAAAREQLTMLKQMSATYHEQAATLAKSAQAGKAGFLAADPMHQALAISAFKKLKTGAGISAQEHAAALAVAPQDEALRDKLDAGLFKAYPSGVAQFDQFVAPHYKEAAGDKEDKGNKVDITIRDLQQNIILKIEPEAERIANALATKVKGLMTGIFESSDIIQQIKRNIEDMQAQNAQRQAAN